MRSDLRKYKKYESLGVGDSHESSKLSRPARPSPVSLQSTPSETPSPPTRFRSFVQNSVAQTLPSEPLELAKEWGVWEGTEELALSSNSRLMQLDLSQTVLQSAEIDIG